MNAKKKIVEKLQIQSRVLDYKNWEKENKREKENNRVLQIFGCYSLGLQKEVCHFHFFHFLEFTQNYQKSPFFFNFFYSHSLKKNDFISDVMVLGLMIFIFIFSILLSWQS